jgi:hypothetical protein
MITRKSLADIIDGYDEQIADLNKSKRDTFDDYRNQMIAARQPKAEIKAEIEAVKVAIKRRRESVKDKTALIEKDALVDEVFEEITRAPRATREIVEKIATDGTKYDAETGVILEEESAPATQGEAGALAPHGGKDVESSAERASRRDENESDLNASRPLEPTRGEDEDMSGRSHGQAAGRYPESQTDGNETVAVVGDESGTVDNYVPSFMKTSSAFAQPVSNIRPHCQRPGKENCGGYGSNHCHLCLVALANGEAA